MGQTTSFPTRRQWLLASLAAGTLALQGCAQLQASPADTAGLQAALDAPHRSADNRARDVFRHPLQTLKFFGLRPEHTVIELTPGGGWYTEILAPYLRERGRYIAAHFAADDPAPAHAARGLASNSAWRRPRPCTTARWWARCPRTAASVPTPPPPAAWTWC